MLIEQTFSTGPVTLNYAATREPGPPLVLLHGVTMRWQAWLPLAPFVSQQWQVFAPDFRGHGRSSRVPGGYRGEDFSADIITFLEHRIQQPAVLFGHSLGGLVTTYVAAVRPDLVRAIILGDSPVYMESIANSAYPELFATIRDYLVQGMSPQELVCALANTEVRSPLGCACMKDLPFNDEAFLRWWAQSLLQLDPEVLEMAIDGRLAENWRGLEFVRQIRCPVMLMQADPKWGGIMTAEDVACAKSVLHDVVHVCLEGVGHALHIYQPQPVARVLGNFLASL
jgi:pimeloyl-ACP methyl ester carboxylesterase